MKIKLLRTPRPGQEDMVCQTKTRTCSVEVGKTLDLADDEALYLIEQWPGCFDRVEETQRKRVDPAELAQKTADYEAGKMAKGYKNKKMQPKG